MFVLFNLFKYVIVKGELQIGCWFGFVELYIVEISVGVGFDWFLIDGEYVLNDLWLVVV